MAIATDLWCSSECTPPCQGGGRGFKSRQVRHRAPTRLRAVGARLPGRVAQLVERAPEKREVTGSTPVPTTGKVLLTIFGFWPPDGRADISCRQVAPTNQGVGRVKGGVHRHIREQLNRSSDA